MATLLANMCSVYVPFPIACSPRGEPWLVRRGARRLAAGSASEDTLRPRAPDRHWRAVLTVHFSHPTHPTLPTETVPPGRRERVASGRRRPLDSPPLQRLRQRGRSKRAGGRKNLPAHAGRVSNDDRHDPSATRFHPCGLNVCGECPVGCCSSSATVMCALWHTEAWPETPHSGR
jgi:hypothetical protein